jgi:hypothetical protein
MVGTVDAWSVEPVVNPSLREGKRHRLIRMTKEQVSGRTGPVRQVRYRDQVVSPLALELACRKLLRRAQRAVDLVARTAADQHATAEITGLAEQAAEAAQALRETLQRAAFAAEALALPERLGSAGLSRS